LKRKIVRSHRILLACATLVIAVLCGSSCPSTYYNLTTTLGGDVPGQRTNIQVSFINETPFRAIFTFGTYDPFNTLPNTPLTFPVEAAQFFVDADPVNRLEGNSESAITSFTCGRALSVGDPTLIELVRNSQNLVDTFDPTALQAGIAFSDRPVDDPDAALPTAGRAQGIVTLQGAEYQCDSLLVYTLSRNTARTECIGGLPLAADCFSVSLEVFLP